MTTDTDALEANIRNLERENRELRITLRDEFAMAALPSIISAVADKDIDESKGFTVTATLAYMMADAMMEARK